jgi:NADP-dependent 3-hydroxy acid dehydrogenase YdfG
MQKTVHQKTIVITGASAGVGRAAALRFARAGANLALIARDAHALNDLKSEVEAIGARAIVLPVDVADADAVFKAADIVAKSLGSIDVWINNAMVTVFSPVWLITPGEFRRVTEVTYFGVVNGTMAALRHMRPRNHGTIINVGSALAYRAIPLQAAYCGAKHAIRGFTDSLRSELIQPRPVPPIVQPEVIAEVMAGDRPPPRPRQVQQRSIWLCSHHGRTCRTLDPAADRRFRGSCDWLIGRQPRR